MRCKETKRGKGVTVYGMRWWVKTSYAMRLVAWVLKDIELIALN